MRERNLSVVFDRTCRIAVDQGGVPLDMIQRYLNLWFALSLDLFGGEISSNAASFFASAVGGLILVPVVLFVVAAVVGLPAGG